MLPFPKSTVRRPSRVLLLQFLQFPRAAMTISLVIVLPGFNSAAVVHFPRFQESCHPFDQYTRGLEDMTNASLQRGRQG